VVDHRRCLKCGLDFETAFNSVRAWSIWSYAYVTIAAVIIVSPLQVCDS